MGENGKVRVPAVSAYGVGFDNLAERWAHNENEHDRMHPDRSQCGGVGGCPMMREAVDLERSMIDQLEEWRLRPALRGEAGSRG